MALSPMHLSIISEAMQAVRLIYPGKEEHEYRRAESILKTHVKVSVRKGLRTYTLNVGTLKFKRTENV